jgi:hypothetical protein
MLDKLWYDLLGNADDVIEDVLHGVGVILLVLTAPLWLPFWLLTYFINR